MDFSKGVRNPPKKIFLLDYSLIYCIIIIIISIYLLDSQKNVGELYLEQSSDRPDASKDAKILLPGEIFYLAFTLLLNMIKFRVACYDLPAE